eukprot:scaffold896_cov172-Amphora_coffeaeformis.AAC.7
MFETRHDAAPFCLDDRLGKDPLHVRATIAHRIHDAGRLPCEALFVLFLEWECQWVHRSLALTTEEVLGVHRESPCVTDCLIAPMFTIKCRTGRQTRSVLRENINNVKIGNQPTGVAVRKLFAVLLKQSTVIF